MSNLLVPEAMSPLYVRNKLCMGPFHVWSKVCIAPIHVRRKVCKFVPHMNWSNADFAPHMEGSHTDFAPYPEQRHSFRDQRIAKIASFVNFKRKYLKPTISWEFIWLLKIKLFWGRGHLTKKFTFSILALTLRPPSKCACFLFCFFLFIKKYFFIFCDTKHEETYADHLN